MVCYSHIPASLGLGKLTGVAIVLALMKPRKKAAVNWRHAWLILILPKCLNPPQPFDTLANGRGMTQPCLGHRLEDRAGQAKASLNVHGPHHGAVLMSIVKRWHGLTLVLGMDGWEGGAWVERFG